MDRVYRTNQHGSFWNSRVTSSLIPCHEKPVSYREVQDQKYVKNLFTLVRTGVFKRVDISKVSVHAIHYLKDLKSQLTDGVWRQRIPK